ncbi:MAG: DUF4037 domain-containing protein [Desulfotalea sp.]
MKGLELSRKFYLEVGHIGLQQFGTLAERIAIGMVGPGSECFGFDDKFSRDHDWGPGFCLWLRADDFVEHGDILKDFYNSLPKSYAGFAAREESVGEDFRTGPMSIDAFYKRYTGLNSSPKSIDQWNISSANLALCVNGEVFCDPLGEFSQWRKDLLNFYPEDMRRKKIADCCMKAGQAGQYNWQRGIMRQDIYVINSAKTQFVTEVMQLVFLLNRSYAPYFKWLYKSFQQLPVLATDLVPLLDGLMFSNVELQGNGAWSEQQDRIEKICGKVVAEIKRQGVSDVDSVFLLDHLGSIISGIKDKQYVSHSWRG